MKTDFPVRICVLLNLFAEKAFGSAKLDFSTVKSKPVGLPLAEEHALFGVSLI